MRNDFHAGPVSIACKHRAAVGDDINYLLKRHIRFYRSQRGPVSHGVRESKVVFYAHAAALKRETGNDDNDNGDEDDNNSSITYRNTRERVKKSMYFPYNNNKLLLKFNERKWHVESAGGTCSARVL